MSDPTVKTRARRDKTVDEKGIPFVRLTRTVQTGMGLGFGFFLIGILPIFILFLIFTAVGTFSG